jgi:hypothetical protein
MWTLCDKICFTVIRDQLNSELCIDLLQRMKANLVMNTKISAAHHLTNIRR